MEGIHIVHQSAEKKIATREHIDTNYPNFSMILRNKMCNFENANITSESKILRSEQDLFTQNIFNRHENL